MKTEKEWFVARMANPFVKWREIVPDEHGFEYLGNEEISVKDDKIIIELSGGQEKSYSREAFTRHYFTQDPETKKKFPIEITDEESLELIETAKSLEWYAEHAVRNYRGKMEELFTKICETHNIDREKVAIRLDGVPPMLYYLGDTLPSIKDDAD